MNNAVIVVDDDAYEKAVLAGLKLAQGRGVSRDELHRFVAARLFDGDSSRVNNAMLDAALERNIAKSLIAPSATRLPAVNDTASSLEKCTFIDRVGSFTDRGDREYQEDRFAISQKRPFAVGVYDGHCGSYVSERLADEKNGLIQTIVNDSKSGSGILPPRASRSAARALFEAYDAQMRSQTPVDRDGDYAGSTACVLIRRGASVALYNVGDSRAVLYDPRGNVLLHTTDHSPEAPKECRRVLEAGGTVEYDVGGCFRVDGFLAMARAFGDYQLKNKANGGKATLQATPDVFVAPLSKTDTTYAIVGSDGLWDGIGIKEAGERLAESLRQQRNQPSREHKQINLNQIAARLGAEALAETRKGDESADNVTVLVVEMKPISC
jgi:serine/threonine protein phosphatase PrpC